MPWETRCFVPTSVNSIVGDVDAQLLVFSPDVLGVSRSSVLAAFQDFGVGEPERRADIYFAFPSTSSLRERLGLKIRGGTKKIEAKVARTLIPSSERRAAASGRLSENVAGLWDKHKGTVKKSGFAKPKKIINFLERECDNCSVCRAAAAFFDEKATPLSLLHKSLVVVAKSRYLGDLPGGFQIEETVITLSRPSAPVDTKQADDDDDDGEHGSMLAAATSAPCVRLRSWAIETSSSSSVPAMTALAEHWKRSLLTLGSELVCAGVGILSYPELVSDISEHWNATLCETSRL